MATTDFRVSAKAVNILPDSINHVDVELEDVDLNELIQQIGDSTVLDEFNTEDIVKHFGIDNLLEQIGEEETRKYFGIEENDNV